MHASDTNSKPFRTKLKVCESTLKMLSTTIGIRDPFSFGRSNVSLGLALQPLVKALSRLQRLAFLLLYRKVIVKNEDSSPQILTEDMF